MISGTTRFVPLLAHPCRHVRTPGVFNAECAGRGIDMAMVPLDVRPDMLAQTIAALVESPTPQQIIPSVFDPRVAPAVAEAVAALA